MRLTALRSIAIIGSAWLCACNTLLGIEDLKAGRPDGGVGTQTGANVAADGGSTGSSGKAGAGNAAVNGGSAAVAGSFAAGGGGPGGAGSAGHAAAAGSAASNAEAGTSAAGGGGSNVAGSAAVGGGSHAGAGGPTAGAGGTDVTPAGTIHGRVIDSRRRVLANVAVNVGNKTTQSNAQGEFSLDGVDASYDLGLSITSSDYSNRPVHTAWLFQGLTRRDPTLQVYDGLPWQVVTCTLQLQNVTFPLPDTQRVYAAFGSVDGDFAAGIGDAMTSIPNSYWVGPDTIQGMMHALHVTVDSASELPMGYLAHAVRPASLKVGSASQVTLDLADATVPSGIVTGTVTQAAGRSRMNWAEVRWTDGAVMNVALDDAPKADAFSYLVPTLPNSSITMVAVAGSVLTPPYAAAFVDNVKVGQNDVTLALPNSPTQAGPADAKTGVDGSTTFQWGGEPNVYVLVAKTDSENDALYVVTHALQTKLPVAPLVPYAPPANTKFRWHVETHGSFASVDDATADAGLISEFHDRDVHYPKQGTGTYAMSAEQTFTTAP